jgi:hypothetical protein
MHDDDLHNGENFARERVGDRLLGFSIMKTNDVTEAEGGGRSNF